MTTSLSDRISTAFVWIAAFSIGVSVFLSITLLFRSFPPTEPVAIGVVTIERYSKLRDYVSAALFFLLVPPLTLYMRGVLARAVERMTSFAERALFTLPWLLGPFFYLTTGKVGWVLLLPLAISLAGPRGLRFARTRYWLRAHFDPGEGAWHALLFASATGWILFRYLVTGRRIAHAPSLFLEMVFVALFLGLFWAAALLVSRTAELGFGLPGREGFQRVAVASLPMALLPFVAVAWVPLPHPRFWTAGAVALAIVLGWTLRPPKASSARNLAAYAILPALIYLFSYASTAQLSQWIDLFHRGEAIGPASDYLRGRIPYVDVFPLHGMLEDGLLDAWLMQLFGRSLDVAVARTVFLGAFLLPAIWFLGMMVFRSIPLAILCVAMGTWTTAENNRTFFQVAAVALYWNALARRSRLSAIASGIFAGVALFFSYDIGLYSIAGGFAAALLLALATRRGGWEGMAPGRAALWFGVGCALGAAPFGVYLAARGALDEFFVVSLVTIPRSIDAVWSLPFPDLVSVFRKAVDLDALADFVLREKFHLIVSPLTIAVSAVYYLAQVRARRAERLDHALMVLGVFALIAQRTAFGRAEFRHQYFAAFLIGPMLVILGVIAGRRLLTLWREREAAERVVVAAVVIVALPVIAVIFWIPDLIDARLADFTKYSARVLRVERDGHAEEVAMRIDDVSAAVRELTPRGEPMFDFSNQPAFYFFADRPNATRFYQTPILSPPPLQAEAIEAIDRAGVPVVIRKSPELFDQFDGVTNDLRAQALAAYLDEMYRFHRSIRGVELWTRKPGAVARPIPEYLRAFRVPDRKELVAGGIQRMLFPAVGSLAGLGGSFWQSDLTLHNPFRDPLPVTLRLVAGDRGGDRRLVLAPHRTMRWPDVVSSLFGVRGHAGTLWIEHREGRAPVAMVRTSDVAHSARASLEKALTMRDAATAGSDRPELAVVGVPPASDARRVNLGVVNVGRIPATFRISVRTRTGETIGQSVESGVGEDQLWLVTGAEHALGVQLDETMTIRIEVIAGSGVGYATVVATNGDAEFIAAVPVEP